MGVSVVRPERDHVGWQRKPLGHLVFGVVVAIDDECRNAGGGQPTHLACEEHAGVVVLPVAVVQIAGDDHEIDLLIDGRSHQVRERFASSGAQQLGRRVGIGRQPGERTVEMDVGGVDELHRECE